VALADGADLEVQVAAVGGGELAGAGDQLSLAEPIARVDVHPLHVPEDDVDIVIAHVRRVYVAPGDRVRRGRLIARASDAGAPDGCHLHFEVRPKRAGYTAAVRPHDYLGLSLD